MLDPTAAWNDSMDPHLFIYIGALLIILSYKGMYYGASPSTFTYCITVFSCKRRAKMKIYDEKQALRAA